MTTYATNNPVGSTDPRDLYDNSQNFDHLSVDNQNEFWPDRKGNNRLTWFGMEKRYNEKLMGMGWELLDSFQAGATINRPDQALRWKLPDGDGEYYRWNGELPKYVPPGSTPATTGGIGNGAWVGIGDAALRSMLLSEGGDRYVYGFSNIQTMAADATLVPGQKVSTGGSRWEIVSEATPMPIVNGVYAKLINELYVDDFAGTGTDKINALNAYITAGLASSYASVTALETYKYSLRPVTVLFTSRVESTVPLLLMRHVHYDQVGAPAYFNRNLKVGLHYMPSDLNTCATEPVVFTLSGGVYSRLGGVLIATPDNPIGGDADYITMSDGFVFDLSVSTASDVKLGLNFCACPAFKSSRLSIGVIEASGNAVSCPLVGMMISLAWGHSLISPKVLAKRQGIVYVRANAGGVTTNPYVARAGSNSSNLTMVYTTPEITAAGKNVNAGITVLTTRDFVIDSPVVEWWRQMVIMDSSDVTIRSPHHEDVASNPILINQFVVRNSWLEVDDWSGISVTASGPVVYSIAMDGYDRAVILKGTPATGGPTGGIVGGSYTNAFLDIETVNDGQTDFGTFGDWNAVRRFGLPFPRDIYVNPTTGSDSNTGLTSARPLATVEQAIKNLNIIERLGIAKSAPDMVINVLSNATMSSVVRAFKSFRLSISSITLNTSSSGYIELYGDLNIQLSNGTVAGSAEALLRHVYGKLNVEVSGTSTISTPAIVRTISQHPITLTQNGGITTGISRYVDGAGPAPVILMVKSANRNTTIDSVPVSTNQYLVGSRITN